MEEQEYMSNVLIRRRRSRWPKIAGLLVVAAYVFAALFAPVLAPFSETEVVGLEYEPWGAPFLLGTDNLGRDMLSRLLFGARNTVGIAFVTTCLAFVIGIIAGLIAQGKEPLEAAELGVALHAAAGDRAALQGEIGMLAGDMLNELRGLLNRIKP